MKIDTSSNVKLDGNYLYNDHGLIMRGGMKYSATGITYYGGDTHAGIGNCKKNSVVMILTCIGSREPIWNMAMENQQDHVS